MVQIIESFSGSKRTWSLADLSGHLALPKSTLHRFLVSLETHGILRRDPQDKLWRLGYRLVSWGRTAEECTGLADVARPVMRQIARATNETVTLTVYADLEVICIEKIDTRHSVRLALEVGQGRPAHAGASSKILMAFLPESEVRAIILERGLPRLCTNTITQEDELLPNLDQIRQKGFASSVEETDPGAWGIATPIRDSRGHVVAAMGIIGPLLRFTDALAQEYVDICRRASDEITMLIGGVPAEPMT
jgi:DNA-binding IclR family transcriptional regulator